MAEETYTIKRNDVLGRYIVAKRSLKQGEIILKEQPTLIGPQICGSMICFKCCNNLRNGYISCLRCKIAPICTPKCVGRFHDNIECDLMAKTSLTTEMIAHYSQIIFPLRCLLLKQANSQLWEEIMALESHLEARRNSAIWRQHRINVEKVLLQLKLINEVDLKDEIIQKICGIIDVNTFEVRSPEMCQNMAAITNPTALCLRGLYLKAALMAHNCTANTSVSIDNNFTLTITASVDIPENSVIFINYANVLQGNLERKQHLREGKYFQCICKRCKDSTELGTNLSTLVCYKCRNGLIRMKSETEWGCSRCKFVVRNCLIHLTVEQAKRNLEDVDQTDISAMELLLRKFSTTFHTNHYLNVELKQFLIGAYSRLVKIHKKQLLRKIFLCKELLDVINILEPGISRLNSITKYELHAAEVILAHKLFNSQEIQQNEFVERLLVAEKYLKDAIKGLLYEPVNSPEGILAQKALSELKLLRMSTINVNLTSGEETKAKNMLVGRKSKKEASVEEINVNNDQKLANSNKHKKNKKNKSGRKKE